MHYQTDPREIAKAMGDAERDKDLAALDHYLNDDLVFRRGDGSVVGKTTFLEDVPKRTYDRISSEIVDDEVTAATNAASVVVTLIVRAAGKGPPPEEKPFRGSFRNVRVFVRDRERWRCKIWVNTKLDVNDELGAEMLHHVSLPVSNLQASTTFYATVLCLRPSKIPRPGPPRFNFEGAWFQVGAGQLHLIVPEKGAKSRPTFREAKEIDSRDVHFAMRVHSFTAAFKHLNSLGYSTAASDPFRRLKVSEHQPNQGAGFPQIYLLDPDHHVIELNALIL